MQATTMPMLQPKRASERNGRRITSASRRRSKNCASVSRRPRAVWRTTARRATMTRCSMTSLAGSCSIRDAEERLKRIEAEPIPKPPRRLQAHPYFNTGNLQSREIASATGLGKSLGGRCILRDINFTLAPAARVVLIGPNGAGKTTLLKLIMGLETPGEGAVRVATGARLGYLPQEPDLPDLSKTVLEAYRYGRIGYEDEFVAKLIGYGL